MYSLQKSLTTDLEGTIGMLKEKLGGAVDALKNALPNNERKRLVLKEKKRYFQICFKCWTICETTNLIIQILVDGLLPAAALHGLLSNHGHATFAGAQLKS